MPATQTQSKITGMPFLDAIAERAKALAASDAQYRDALPIDAVTKAKLRSELGLAQIVALVMEGYGQRPALGQRATVLTTDSTTGRTRRRLLDRFETVSYRDLWSQARAIASAWYHDEAKPLRANDFVCILAFAGIDFTTVDLAATHNGAVVVPLQSNGAISQLQDIVKEVEPQWLATSLECLETAVELVLTGCRGAGVLLFDYHAEVDSEREVYEAARSRFASAGLADALVTKQEMCARGEALPAAPLFEEAGTEERLCSVIYTSGSTGLPKGAMYPERMVTWLWRMDSPIPYLYMHYMPMNHMYGRGGVFVTLGGGGTCYFTAKSDLSSIFADISLVRPTYVGFVTRTCEMIHQQFEIELERRKAGVTDIEGLKQELMLEFRNKVLGGRLLICSFTSAPVAPELRAFMENCLGYPLDDSYGTTEIASCIRNTYIQRPPVIDYKLDDVPELGYFKTDKPYPRGELLVKTSTIMLGYFKRPEVTASVFDDQGYYKTGDIMAEIGPDRLVYVDRRNNVLKLAQGEFVALSRLETIFNNGHPLIRQAYLYGVSERSYLVGAFVPNEDALKELGITDDVGSIKRALREAIKQVARDCELKAYEVPRDFLVERRPFSVENGLLTGLGKYQRPRFKEYYGPRLEKLYEDIAAGQANEIEALHRMGRDAPTRDTVARAVQATLGIENIDPTKRYSFAELGGDSISALSCSILLHDIYDVEVPVGVINNPASDLHQVALFIERARAETFQRPTFASVHGRGATAIRASDLTPEKFLDVATLNAARHAGPTASGIRTVLVTGATGYLGRFLCLQWLERLAETGGRVICIARGQDRTDAAQRITGVFDSGDEELKEYFERFASTHLEVLAGDLSEADLGLSEADWQRLAQTVDLIVHPAALVNHVLPYSQLFGPNVVGTAELIRLAITHRLKPINYVSTVAAAILPDGGALDEDADVRTATPVRRLEDDRYADGYANSKWAGEVLLREAHDRFGLPVSVFRSDMILAHSSYKGQINVPDMFTRWLYSIMVTGVAPRSFYTAGSVKPHYDGLPVDFIAASIIALGANALSGFRTYHVVNPHEDAISMDSFIDWAVAAGYPIKRIENHGDWFNRFATALRALPDKQRRQTSLLLLRQMRQPMPATAGSVVSAARFAAEVRAHGMDIPHLSAPFIRKYLDDLRVVGLV